MNKDQVEGRVKEAAGKVQETAGKAVGSTTQQVKGAAHKVAGAAQAKYGDVKNDLNKQPKQDRSGSLACHALPWNLGSAWLSAAIFAPRPGCFPPAEIIQAPPGGRSRQRSRRSVRVAKPR